MSFLHAGLFKNSAFLEASDVSLLAIARPLSREARFRGFAGPYNVAEHSIRASYCVPERLAMHALLHDASEAWMRDLPRGLKHMEELRPYCVIENRVQCKVAEAMGIDPNDFRAPEIHAADNWQLAVEVERFFLDFASYDFFGGLKGPAPAWVRRIDGPLIPQEHIEWLFVARWLELSTPAMRDKHASAYVLDCAERAVDLTFHRGFNSVHGLLRSLLGSNYSSQGVGLPPENGGP